ncbi:MAG: hypothetical protein ACI8ZF_000492 [Candidatus Midichloriaceae bacterium]|jgi:uncharacterized protein YaaW (UPF0174 family)
MENDNQLKKIDVENFKEDSISEFTKNDFRKFGTKNIEKNMYYFYTDTSVNEVEADTVYDAINKVDIKNVTKIINSKNLLSYKQVFFPEELIKYQNIL